MPSARHLPTPPLLCQLCALLCYHTADHSYSVPGLTGKLGTGRHALHLNDPMCVFTLILPGSAEVLCVCVFVCERGKDCVSVCVCVCVCVCPMPILIRVHQSNPNI